MKKILEFYRSLDPNKQQHLQLGGIIAAGIILFLVFSSFFSSSSPEGQEGRSNDKNDKGEHYRIESPGASLSSSEAWVARVERKNDELKGVLEKSQEENKTLAQRLEILEERLKKGELGLKSEDNTDIDSDEPSIPFSQNKSAKNLEDDTAEDKSLEKDIKDKISSAVSSAMNSSTDFQDHIIPSQENEEKFIHLSVADNKMVKSAENYVPVTTIIHAVMTSGMAVSTAESASSNPKPVTLRCVDDGSLPRGWRSKLKDAQINASCYGDISTERAVCRLSDISWVEEDGTVVERKVEGWIYGPDGREGLRGIVVDRAEQFTKDAFLAGLLGGFSEFFQAQATKQSPQGLLGLTNPLSAGDAAKGALGNGATSAFDKLAEFYIKKADSMSPVIVVNGGQVVDIRLKKGFFLSEEEGEYQSVGLVENATQSNSGD